MTVSVRLWGTRGSIATPGPDMSRYGGNTACVEVRSEDGTVLILDAGTGIRRLGVALGDDVRRVDVLLTHLHMDHIQGLGFFSPLFASGVEVHIYGPASPTLSLRERLSRYLSPPLFPVHLRDLIGTLHLHELPGQDTEIGPFRVSSMLVCHPNPTVGLRIEGGGGTVTYLPDHEPALGRRNGWLPGMWTSGYGLAKDTDLLIHDAQYTADEYQSKIGWGHSTVQHALEFASLTDAKHLVLFHHDPAHNDDDLDAVLRVPIDKVERNCIVTPGKEGATFLIGV